MYKCKYKGGDYFEEVGFVAGSHTAYGYGISTDSVSRTGRNADHFTCVLYSFCRSFAVCSHYASCKGRMVGKPPASCSGILAVPAL